MTERTAGIRASGAGDEPPGPPLLSDSHLKRAVFSALKKASPPLMGRRRQIELWPDVYEFSSQSEKGPGEDRGKWCQCRKQWSQEPIRLSVALRGPHSLAEFLRYRSDFLRGPVG